MRIADEKVNLAHQIYDYVDQHIRRLDKDLKQFDGELTREQSRLGLVVRPARLSAMALDACMLCEKLITLSIQFLAAYNGPRPSSRDHKQPSKGIKGCLC